MTFHIIKQDTCNAVQSTPHNMLITANFTVYHNIFKSYTLISPTKFAVLVISVILT